MSVSAADLPSALVTAVDPAADTSRADPTPAGTRYAVFLDYDGVLTPIVDRPEDAIITEEMAAVVRGLASRATVCIVSGRDRAVIEQLSGLDDLIIAGSHGFDIHDPATGTIAHDASSGFEDLVATVTADVRDRAADVAGTLVEPKHASVALHYRSVDPAEHGRVQEIVDGVLAEHPDELRVTPGKFVHEIQPKIDWNKGRAVEHLLGVLGLDGVDDTGRHVLPIYLGDDVTDEDAFRALAPRGGVGILVIDPSESGTRSTDATATLADVDEVGRFLDGLAR